MAAFAQSLNAVQPAPKQRAVIMLEVATAARQQAATTRDTARAVLDLGGQIEAVVPAALYGAGLPADAHAEYDRLLARAVTVHRLPFTQSTSEAHMGASELMLDHAGQLWAVWDGQPARGYGGTADVVAAARANGLPVRVIWPHGAHRD